MTYNHKKNSDKFSELTPREAIENAINLSKEEHLSWDDNMFTHNSVDKKCSKRSTILIPSEESA